MKNRLKIIGAIAITNLIENLLLLLLFGVKITQNTLIGAGVFTIALTLLLKQLNVLKD